LKIIDTHAHLDMPEFETDRHEVIQRAFDSGVKQIITIGINPESNLRALKIAEEYPAVFAGIGIHPQDSEGKTDPDFRLLNQQARHPKVVAIGELGLDFHREQASRSDQMRVLEGQLEIVKEINKPIVIHCRDAHAAFLPVITAWLKSYSPPENRSPGVLHCFSLDAESARPYLEMGFYVSIGAYIGYPSSAKLRETVKTLPPERLLIETDCPFLPPQKMRGKRNEPAYCLITAGVLAECQGLSLEEMADLTSANALRVFNLG
jgi:TatD DNase family protein